MSTVKINQKNYEIPELTFRHLPLMEKCGLSLRDMMSSKYIFTVVQTFTAIVVECDTDQADYLLEQHILGGGTVMPIYDAFMDAMRNSHFFKTLLERGQEKKNQKAQAPETLAETNN